MADGFVSDETHFGHLTFSPLYVGDLVDYLRQLPTYLCPEQQNRKATIETLQRDILHPHKHYQFSNPPSQQHLTMALTLHETFVTAMIRHCEILSDLIDKAIAHADSKSIPHEELIEAQLISDMKGFGWQIQRVSDTCKHHPNPSTSSLLLTRTPQARAP